MLVTETGRLTIRRLTTDDAAFILRLLNEPSFIENIGDRQVRTIEQAASYILEGPVASYERHGHGLCLVALRETGMPVGMCGLLRRDHLDAPDIGYAFLPEFWSRGYAVEAAAAILENGRSASGISRVLAIVSPGNSSSIRVLEKLGFKAAGMARMPGEGTDVALFELAR